jgi:hypothetical protein
VQAGADIGVEVVAVEVLAEAGVQAGLPGGVEVEVGTEVLNTWR